MTAILHCVFIWLFAMNAIGISANEQYGNNANQYDLSVLFEKFEFLEKRLSSLENENEKQRKEIYHLKTALVRNCSPVGDEKQIQGKSNRTKDKTYQVKGVANDRTSRQIGSGSTVAFYVSLGKPLYNIGKNQNVQFDTVVTNTGNGYDSSTGTFRASVPGVYVFSSTVVTDYNHMGHYGFVLNGHMITRMLLDGSQNAYDGSSQTVILQLDNGDDVSIQHTDTTNGLFGYNHSVFSGFLLNTPNTDPLVVVG